MCVVTNYSDDDNADAREIKLDFGKDGKYEVYVVNNEKDGELVGITDTLEFTVEPCSFILVKEI